MDKIMQKVFRDYNNSREKIKEKYKELEILSNGGKVNDMYDTLKAANLNDRVQTSNISDLTSQQVIKMCNKSILKDMAERAISLKKEIQYYMILREDMENYFDMLDIHEMELVELLYIYNTPIAYLPGKMNYNPRHVRRIRVSAEKKFRSEMDYYIKKKAI